MNATGPIRGTLSDADVKSLLVNAARARTAEQLHAVIKTLVLNRVALIQVIQALTVKVRESAVSNHSSKFDVALLEQLQVMRAELEAAERERLQAVNEARSANEKLTRSERMHDLAQRLAERVQRELLLANMERERLGEENLQMADRISAQAAQLQLLNDEVTVIRHRLLKTGADLEATITQGREIAAERDALRSEVTSSIGDNAELRRRLTGHEKLVEDLREAVRKHIVSRSEDQKMIQYLSVHLMKLQRAQGMAATAPAPSAAPVAGGGNVVAFSSTREIERLREQLRSRDATIAQKDQSITQLQTANNSLKSRMGEIESRVNQIEVTNRAQSIAHESLAKTLLSVLPEEQREIYSSPSHDASSLMLIADAVKRHTEQASTEQQFSQDGLLQSM